ncbi:hypothetical protein E5S67_03383 [Microcoleus sp. IPMA8]|uniref:Uncharacterized protein n=1 Tax=Microcoleus asticus IPMA8 TaxID=2563858 RepID=A0ABX2CZM0_9CYAN|nr:hypothetical protein [Microcoleus asticus IPMA8]
MSDRQLCYAYNKFSLMAEGKWEKWASGRGRESGGVRDKENMALLNGAMNH